MAEGHVLLVDDEEEFVELLAERMRTRGLTVRTAHSGAAAIALLEQESFDAVVLDMVMPEMDGLETLRRLHEKKPELQVILLTGYADLPTGITAIRQGAADYLEKPADINQLLTKINNAKTRTALLFEERMQEKIGKILRKKGW
jgi:DNA-binding NtrC family response regulator